MNQFLKNKTSSTAYALIIGTAVLFLNGCARDISSNSYSDRHVGESSRTYKGRILSVRTVKVGPEQLGDSYAGTAIGGIGGGVIGNQFGGGHGNIATTLGGAAIGALAGAFLEQELKNQDAYEYVVEIDKGITHSVAKKSSPEYEVELDKGAMYTVVQGMDTKLSPGQPVLLMISHQGRSRLIPNQSGF